MLMFIGGQFIEVWPEEQKLLPIRCSPEDGVEEPNEEDIEPFEPIEEEEEDEGLGEEEFVEEEAF